MQGKHACLLVLCAAVLAEGSRHERSLKQAAAPRGVLLSPASAPAPGPALDCRSGCDSNPFTLPNGIDVGPGPVIPEATLNLRKAVNASTTGTGGSCGAQSVTPETLALGIAPSGRVCEAHCECCSGEGVCGCGNCGAGCQPAFSGGFCGSLH